MDLPLKNSIKNWAEDDRPREKLMLKGANSLSDAELTAILINSGNAEESAVELSQRILNDVSGNLIELSKLTVHDLQRYKGIGEAKAITIVAALELGKRRRSADILERKQIKSSKDAFEILQEKLADQNYELFCIVMLNRANKVIRTEYVSEGGVSGTAVDPKRIFRMALEYKASSVILGHNHPSGQVTPSEADIKLTEKLKKAGDNLEIPVLDHLIVGDERYYSFADEGILGQ